MEMIDKNGNKISMTLAEYKEYMQDVRTEKIQQISNRVNEIKTNVNEIRQTLQPNQYVSNRNNTQIVVTYKGWTNDEIKYLIEHLTEDNEKIGIKLGRTRQSVYMKIDNIKQFLFMKYVKRNTYENKKLGLNAQAQPKEYKAQYSKPLKHRKNLHNNPQVILRKRQRMVEVNTRARELMHQDNTLTLSNALKQSFKEFEIKKQIMGTLNDNVLMKSD